ncbi:transglutaminase-like domain-containing protein [Isosphaeraceae bacterium EP7]
MPTKFEHSPEFRKLLAGDPAADLTLIALEIGRDADPTITLGDYVSKIDDLSERVRARCPAGCRTAHVLGQINWVLFIEEGYTGNEDEYDDPRNSYLHEVMERKTGIPISLCLLYRAVAERLGLEMDGVNLPAHFMLRIDGDFPIYVDAFHSGALLDPPGCARQISRVVGKPVELSAFQLAPARPQSIVARMLRNLKMQLLRRDDYAAARRVIERLVAIDRCNPIEQRDLGLVCVRTDRPGEAIRAFNAYLQAVPDADDAEEIRSLIGLSMREIARRN